MVRGNRTGDPVDSGFLVTVEAQCAEATLKSVALNYNRLLTEWETETARLALVHLKRWRIARYSWVRYLTDISTEIKD